jgi:hypothetical protein
MEFRRWETEQAGEKIDIIITKPFSRPGRACRPTEPKSFGA